MNRIHGTFGERVAILAVDVDPTEPLPTLTDFAGQAGSRYAYTRDSTASLTPALGVQAMDTTVVLDAAGHIVYRDAVPTDEATLRTALAQAGRS